MAQQTINIGASPNDGTGTPLRTAFQYTNSNFSELYTAVGPSGNNIVVPGSATITGDLTVDTSTLKVDSANDRVGIGAAAPSAKLTVLDTNGIPIHFGDLAAAPASQTACFVGVSTSALAGSGNGDLILVPRTSDSRDVIIYTGSGTSVDRFRISGTGICTWSNVGGVAGTAMTLNATGLGIGVTPSAWAAGFKVIQASTGVAISTNAVVDRCDISANYYFNAGNKFLNATGRASNFSQDGGAFYFYQSTGTSGGVGSAITWGPGMTLDASGNLLVGTTSVSSAFNTKLHISSDSGTTKWAVGPYSSASNFVISAAGGGGVYLNGTAATSWTSASDERLKDIIEPISNAIAKVGSLRAVIGKFKFDQNNTRKPFLIAQDIQAVLPEAVDASNPEQLGVAYTDVIPLLVAAIKELTAEVNALKNA